MDCARLMPSVVSGRLKFTLWVVWDDPCLMSSQVGLPRGRFFLNCVMVFGFELFF